MNKKTYFLAIYKAVEGGYWCTFPDLGIFDQGETIEETVENAKKLLNATLEMAVEADEAITVPTSGDEIKTKLDVEAGEVFCLVPVTVYPPAKTERINITMKGDILARIDDFSRIKNINRSKLMVNATLEYMAQHA